MAEDTMEFLSFASALEIVGDIREEEHPHEINRRIFNVYNKNDQAICWFDAEETIALVAPGEIDPKKEKIQSKVEEYILNHIPNWVMD